MYTQNNKILVKDVMLSIDKFPIVSPKNLIKETIDEMNRLSIGIACIVEEGMILKGVFCDGDIRRTIINNQQSISAFFVDDVIDHITLEYKSVDEQESLIEAVKLMGHLKIWDLPIIDSNFKLKGLLHLHPAILHLLEYSNKYIKSS